jgi:CheY-like chemotaxis protein
MAKVLWADDQPDVARTFAVELEGIDAEFVLTGEEAAARLSERFYDLVLVDLRMPPGTWGGLWLLEEMRRRELFTPVVVISGEGAQNETIQAIRLGAVDYVTKENASQDLRERVAHALARPPVPDGIQHRPSQELLGNLESRSVEFKESARWDVRQGRRDPKIEQEIVKTVAGLLNTAGGTLLVGVRDSGEPVGIGFDLALFGDKRDPRDSFTSWLTDLLTQAIGAADCALVRVRLESLGGSAPICRIDVPASSHPVFVASDDDAFFVRFENSTRRLSPKEVLAYVQERWTSV